MAKEEKREVKLMHTRMKEAGFVRNLWIITAEVGVTREDMVKPDFWAHVASLFRPYDRIEARCDDGTFFAEYLVLTCDRTFAKVKELSYISLTSKDVSKTQLENDLELYYTKFRGPHCKWSVLRKSDDSVMVEKLGSKDDANAWLVNHKKVIA